jgi:hypothetical protein
MKEEQAFRRFCEQSYHTIYSSEFSKLKSLITISKKSKKSVEEQIAEKEAAAEIAAQKIAIRDTIIEALKLFPDVPPSLLWKTIYSIHVDRKSGISDPFVINQVISADNSWKKSSGHAFEEMIKLLGNSVLQRHGIEFILQKDLKELIDSKITKIHNEVRDISWLKEQIRSSVFDLYATVVKDGKRFVFGCIQSKTSVRDRVTRDREPSMHAMQAFFWSIAIVLDGEFLALPKFKAMVNGGTTEYPENGWHGLYVFDKKYPEGKKSPIIGDRIYPIDINLELLVEHAKKAANYWLTQRQWFNAQWRADDNQQ